MQNTPHVQKSNNSNDFQYTVIDSVISLLNVSSTLSLKLEDDSFSYLSCYGHYLDDFIQKLIKNYNRKSYNNQFKTNYSKYKQFIQKCIIDKLADTKQFEEISFVNDKLKDSESIFDLLNLLYGLIYFTKKHQVYDYLSNSFNSLLESIEDSDKMIITDEYKKELLGYLSLFDIL